MSDEQPMLKTVRTKYCFVYCGPERCDCMPSVVDSIITITPDSVSETEPVLEVIKARTNKKEK